MKEIVQNKLLFPEILWERPVHYYKAEAGKILVIAGSKGSEGQALLICESIFRSGTGVLTLAFPEELKNSFTGVLPEAMTLTLPQTPSGSIARKAKNILIEQLKSVDVVLIGPGLSTNTETVQLIWELLPEIKKPLIIDGDGLKALSYGIDAIRGKEGIEGVREYFGKLSNGIVVTPNAGEAGKLLEALGVEKQKCKAEYVELHKKESALIISDYLGATVVLKSFNTVIFAPSSSITKVRPLQAVQRTDLCRPEGVVIINKIDEQNSGEVLSGIIASFVAQNPTKQIEAIATAAYLHSMSEKLAKESLGERTVAAKDIIRFLPEVIKKEEK